MRALRGDGIRSHMIFREGLSTAYSPELGARTVHNAFLVWLAY